MDNMGLFLSRVGSRFEIKGRGRCYIGVEKAQETCSTEVTPWELAKQPRTGGNYGWSVIRCRTVTQILESHHVERHSRNESKERNCLHNNLIFLLYSELMNDYT